MTLSERIAEYLDSRDNGMTPHVMLAEALPIVRAWEAGERGTLTYSGRFLLTSNGQHRLVRDDLGGA